MYFIIKHLNMILIRELLRQNKQGEERSYKEVKEESEVTTSLSCFLIISFFLLTANIKI